MASQLSREDIVRILPVNELLYVRTSPSSPIVSRSQKKSFSEGGGSSTYSPSDRIIVNLQTGTEFIDPLQSFLVFDVKSVGGTARLVGSILNLIRESQMSSRSGQELSRVEYLNLLNYHKLKMAPTDLQSHNLNGLVMYQDSHTATVFDNAVTGVRSNITTTYQRVMIPLKYISGLFDSEKLMPPHIARGLRVDCLLEAYGTALVDFNGANGVTGYIIQKPYILTDNYRMADSVLEFLNAEFASKETGLVYEYFDYHTTTSVVTASNDLNVEVRRSVSMALDAFAVTRLAKDPDDAVEKKTNSFASVVANAGDKSQWRIGSHYLPNQQICGTEEHYAQTLYWANLLRDDMPTGSSYYEFVGGNTISAAVVPYGDMKFPVTLQRNNILDLSGLAINNSSTLELNATLGGGATTRQVQVFMRHLKRCIAFLETVQVET